MPRLLDPFYFLLLAISGRISRRQLLIIDYLREENRVLREQLEGRRFRFNDDQRRRLAAKAKSLGRKVLHEFATIVTPETLLAGHRRLIAQYLYLARRYDQAAVEVCKTLELDANYLLGHFVLGRVYAQQGMVDDAIAAQGKAAEFCRGRERLLPAGGYSPLLCAGRQASRSAPSAPGPSGPFPTFSHVAPYGIATVYAALGDKGQALAQLEQAYAQPSQFMDLLQVDPELDSLRSDPRFHDLLRRMKLR